MHSNSHRKASGKIVKIPPTRTSRRLRGHSAGSESVEGQENIENATLNAANDTKSVDMPKALVTFEEYFPAEVQAQAIKTTGHFTGWVNKTVQERYSIEGNAADAWEKNGGGKFTFKTSGKLRFSVACVVTSPGVLTLSISHIRMKACRWLENLLLGLMRNTLPTKCSVKIRMPIFTA